jgi:excisionase family DNA binding protein
MSTAERVTFTITAKLGTGWWDLPGARWLYTSEVAPLLGVSPKTVTRWANEKKLPCQRTLGGHHRFPEQEIQDLAARLTYRRTP